MQSVAVSAVMAVWSVLVPARQWVAANSAVEVTVKYAAPASPPSLTLLLADFTGSTIAPTGPAEVKDGQTVELKGLYPSLIKPGTYLLFAVPTVKEGQILSAANFVGTPVVIEVRDDKRLG